MLNAPPGFVGWLIENQRLLVAGGLFKERRKAMRRPDIKATLLECIQWCKGKSEREIIDQVDRWVDEFERLQASGGGAQFRQRATGSGRGEVR